MRCNVGVTPAILTDQHLIAEYRELFIPAGQQRKRNFVSCSAIPKRFSLGTGHITFFKNKHLYLQARHQQLVTEMLSRGYSPNLEYDVSDIPRELINMWAPTREDSHLVRDRIAERINEKRLWYRFHGVALAETFGSVDNYLEQLKNSPLHVY